MCLYRNGYYSKNIYISERTVCKKTKTMKTTNISFGFIVQCSIPAYGTLMPRPFL